jgi:O-antigen ligase
VNWTEFLAHPWVGVGAREFMNYCNNYLPALKPQYAQYGFLHSCVIHPHSLYLGMLSEGGIFAFLAFVVMVFLLMARQIRDARINGIPIMAYFGSAVILTTFWPIQPSMEYFNGWTAAVIWMGVAWALARARAPHH